MIKKLLSLLKKPEFWFGIVIFGLLVYMFTRPPSIKVVSTSPKDNTKNVLAIEHILVTFNRNPSPDETKNITIETDPKTEFDLKWQRDTLEATAKDSLRESANYSVKIMLKSKSLYNFTFTTASTPHAQLIESGNKQVSDDYQFSQALQNFLKVYPWYKYLPIETGDYRIVYDFQNNQFRIRILKKGVSDAEQKSIVNNALESLKKIGVPEPISYYVLK